MTIHQSDTANASAECLRSVVKCPLTIELRFGRADATCAATHAGKAAQARRAGGKMNAGWTVPTDAMWARVVPMPSGKATDPGVTATDNRQFIEAVPWRFRTGSRWRDIPERFGNWNSVSGRFGRLALSGVFSMPCQRSPTTGTCSLTARSSGLVRLCREQRGTGRQGIGRSRGGLTSKIVAVVDALGCLVRFVIPPGRAHALAEVPALLDDLRFGAIVGDSAFDAEGLRGVPGPRQGDANVAAPGREPHRENQGVPGGCDAARQDRRELRGGGSPRRRRDRGDMIVKRCLGDFGV